LELTGLPSQNRSQRDARPICQADRVQPWLSLRNGERSCSRRYAASCIFFDVCPAVLVYWSKSKPVLIDAWVSSGPLAIVEHRAKLMLAVLALATAHEDVPRFLIPTGDAHASSILVVEAKLPHDFVLASTLLLERLVNEGLLCLLESRVQNF